MHDGDEGEASKHSNFTYFTFAPNKNSDWINVEVSLDMFYFSLTSNDVPTQHPAHITSVP
jgi:hypothetical protein